MPSTQPPKAGGGDKILGMPKAGAVALFAGAGLLLFLWWQNSQKNTGSSSGGSSSAPRNVYLTLPGHWKRGKGKGKRNG